MSFGQLEQPVRHGRRARGGPSQARQHGGEGEAAGEVAVDRPARAPLGIPLEHGLQELLLHPPGGWVADPEMALQLQGRDAVLLLGEQIHGEKPGGQQELAKGEDAPGGDGCLMAAVPALPEISGLRPAIAFGMAALGTHEPPAASASRTAPRRIVPRRRDPETRPCSSSFETAPDSRPCRLLPVVAARTRCARRGLNP